MPWLENLHKLTATEKSSLPSLDHLNKIFLHHCLMLLHQPSSDQRRTVFHTCPVAGHGRENINSKENKYIVSDDVKCKLCSVQTKPPSQFSLEPFKVWSLKKRHHIPYSVSMSLDLENSKLLSDLYKML